MPQDPNELLYELYGDGENAPTDPDSDQVLPNSGSPQPTPPSGDHQFTTQGSTWTNPQFNPTMPQPELLSLEEMIDMVNRRTQLATQPRIEGLERSREEMQLEGQRRLGEVESGYQRARGDLSGDVARAQQQTSQTAAARGIYDSGLALKLGNQIARKGAELGMQLGEEQARQLADIAEFIHLQSRHNMQEIQSIMGEKGLMAATMLDEMRLEQQRRGDDLAQREFENWLSHQAFQLNEYWREQEFDATQADREWNKWFNEEQFRVQQEQMEWDRIFNMNRWEAEQELQQLAMNNQISQQEFQNALSLDDFRLKQTMFSFQQQQWRYDQQARAMPPVMLEPSSSSVGRTNDWGSGWDAMMNHNVTWR